MQDSRSRKWQLTINNPEEKGMTHEELKSRITKLSSVAYWCMCDEIGEEGTPHTHIYMLFENATRFSTLKNTFEKTHFEMARGTSLQNKEYITKAGKWEKDAKKETNIAETFEESGECPVERQGARNDLADLYSMIKQGMQDYDILEENPDYLTRLDKIERTRQAILEKEYRNKIRELDVQYIWGKAGSGKTRYVMDTHGCENVYRVTDYLHPFDGYRGQDVIVFEEYRSCLPIGDMLNYLDIYPLELPSRYANKIACYTKVYVISNIEFRLQYPQMQLEQPETFNAFKRRFRAVWETGPYPGMLIPEDIQQLKMR